MIPVFRGEPPCADRLRTKIRPALVMDDSILGKGRGEGVAVLRRLRGEIGVDWGWRIHRADPFDVWSGPT